MYTPTEWVSGDIVTAAKLNKIEEGIANAGGGLFVVTATENGSGLILDKTFGEIFTALDSGMLPIMKYAMDDIETEWYPLSGLARKNPGTECSISFLNGDYTFAGIELTDYGQYLW